MSLLGRASEAPPAAWLTFDQLRALVHGPEVLDAATLRELCRLLGPGEPRPWDGQDVNRRISLLADVQHSMLLLDEDQLGCLAAGVDHDRAGALEAALVLLAHPHASERVALRLCGERVADETVRAMAHAGWLAPTVMFRSTFSQQRTWQREPGEQDLRVFDEALARLAPAVGTPAHQLMCELGWAWRGQVADLVRAVGLLTFMAQRAGNAGLVDVGELVELACAGQLSADEVDVLVMVLDDAYLQQDERLMKTAAAMPHLQRRHLTMLAHAARKPFATAELARALMAHPAADEGLAVQILCSYTFKNEVADFVRGGWLAPAALNMMLRDPDIDPDDVQPLAVERASELHARLGDDPEALRVAATLGLTWTGTPDDLVRAARAQSGADPDAPAGLVRPS